MRQRFLLTSYRKKLQIMNDLCPCFIFKFTEIILLSAMLPFELLVFLSLLLLCILLIYCLIILVFTMQKQPPEVLYKSFAILTGKYLRWSHFLIKLRPAGLQLY